MENILKNIVAEKRIEVDAAIRLTGETDPFSATRPVISMKKALVCDPYGIIAEFKRRSPSRGEIHPLALAADVVSGYRGAGATACSVLTDTVFFGGALTDLMAAREAVPDIPVLRKDFIISRNQIAEARVCGADAVLLIAAILTSAEVSDFTAYAHSLDLEILFEVHNDADLDKYCDGIDMVGVNNRDLTTFRTDPMFCTRVAAALPQEAVKIAESGITSLRQVEQLRENGFSGFLIGERFMKHENPAEALRKFLEYE